MTDMKGTELFKQAIKSYLDERAQTDELFAHSYAREGKNIDDCITFILNQAKALSNEGCVGMSDNEVYSLACHYFDEDNIEIGKPINCGVIVNRHIELTEEEKPRHGREPSANTKLRNCVRCSNARASRLQSHRKPNIQNLTYSAFNDETTQQIRESGACPKRQAPPLDQGTACLGIP